MIENCRGDVANLYNAQCKITRGMIVGGILSPTGDGLSFADALLEASWVTEINEEPDARSFVLPYPDNVTVTEEEMQTRESNLPVDKFSRQGKLKIQFDYEEMSDCQWEKLRTMHNQVFYAYLITLNGGILGGSNTTNILPNKVTVMVSRPKLPENKDGQFVVSVMLVFHETEDLFTKTSSPTAFDPKDLEGIIDVDIAFVSSSATSLVISLTGDCDDREISVDFVHTDFQVVSTAGVVRVLSNVARVGNVYTITGVAMASTDVVSMKGQPDMTTNGYEDTGGVAITVV